MIPRGLFLVEFLAIFQTLDDNIPSRGEKFGGTIEDDFFSQPREDEERLIGFAELGFLEVKRCFARG